MKKIGLLLLLICGQTWSYDFSVQTISTDMRDAFLVTIPWPQQSPASDQDWNCFKFCTLYLQETILKPALLENKPVFIAIPDCYQQAKTTADDAPLIEGARVALAWASIYFRFHNLDTRIILVPHTATQEDIINACTNYPTAKKQTDSTSLEERMKNRIQHMNTISLTRTAQSECSNTDVWSLDPQVHTFTPDLPQKKNTKKRVVITGGAGFIGSFLTEKFLSQGHQVIVLDNFACCTKENIQSITNNNLVWYEYDVSNPFTIQGPIDLVIHLASYPSPADYYKKPIETMRTGLHGTKNALELARQKNARFVIGSTSEVYGDPHVHPQPEEYPGHVDPIGKRSQYDQSKRGAETWCKYYFDTYHLDIRIMRIFNTYGPRMRLGDGRVVTNFIKAALENSTITVYGEGKQTRSFGFVSDTVDGIYRVAQSDSITTSKTLDERIFNVGNPGEFSVNEVAQAVNAISLKRLQRPTTITHIPQFDMSDPKVRCPDITRINTITGYNPSISFEQGLEKTFEYFQFKKNRYSEHKDVLVS